MSEPSRLEQSVLRVIQRHHLIPPNSRVVVAVSGGADSLALLHILHALTPVLACTLHVATLDHGLRGQAGAEDAAFVVAEAAHLGLPCTVGKRDIPALAKRWKLGLETAARRARYHFLSEVAVTVGAAHVATGHHADDQAETVLMRMLRGTGIHGLGGMRRAAPLPAPGDHPLTLIRPLLDQRRETLERYVQAKDLHPRCDLTNEDPSTLRNWVRHRVLASQPAAAAHLANLSALAQIDERYFADLLARDYHDAFVYDGDRVTFRRAALTAAPQALRLRLLKGGFQQIAPESAPSFEQMMRCEDAVIHGQVGQTIELPGFWRLRVDYAHVYLERRGAVKTQPTALAAQQALLPQEGTLPVALAVPGETRIPGADWWLCAEDAPSVPTVAAGVSLLVPPDAVVVMRARGAGDRFAPAGLGGHRQKIKQWMIDRKVPRRLRDRVPLLVIDGQVAAICWGERWSAAEPFHPDRPTAPGGRRIDFSIRR
jgi:tRNA(Ile)-lysidine synthase